jgi:subtilisin family serine protease
LSEVSLALSAVLAFPGLGGSALVRSGPPRSGFFLFFEFVFAGADEFLSVAGACLGAPSLSPVASRAVGSCEVDALAAEGALASVGAGNDGASVGEGTVGVDFETTDGAVCVGAGVCCLATGTDVLAVLLGATTGDETVGEAAVVGELNVAERVDTDSLSRLTACISRSEFS